MNFAIEQYGPAVASLLRISAPYALMCGRPVTAARKALAALDHAALFAGKPVVDRQMANACLAGLWLWFDYFDESHSISQDIDTATGSYWHGILHRREPDYSNAKYWFARVQQHPVYEALASMFEISKVRENLGSHWNSAKFVDHCQRATRDRGELEFVCCLVQIAEWQFLFDDSYRQALGTKGSE